MPPSQQRTTLYYSYDPAIRPFGPFEHPAFRPASPGFEDSEFSVVIDSDFVARVVYTYQTLALPLRLAPNAQMNSKDRNKLVELYEVDFPRVACHLYDPASAMLDAFFDKELPLVDDGSGENRNCIKGSDLCTLLMRVRIKVAEEGTWTERKEELAQISVLACVVDAWENAESA